MKGQQIFYSFLPTVTAAVLTTIPLWANTAKVDEVGLFGSPYQLAFIDDGSLVPSLINTQLPTTPDELGFSALFTPIGLTTTSENLLSSSALGVIGGAVREVREGGGNVSGLSGSSSANVSSLVLPASLQRLIIGNNKNPANNQLLTVAQILPSQEANQVSAAVKSKQIAQTNSRNSKTPPVTPIIQQTKPTNPAPTTQQTRPANPTPTVSGPPPAYLNPNPNPLQYPSRAEEVRIEGTQPITLTQALELARRNSLQLQQSILTRDSNRYAVRQAQASLFPTASLNSSITRSGPGFTDQPQSVNPFTRQLVGPSSSTSFSGNAQLSYTLTTSGQRQASIRAAEEQLRSAELDVENQSEAIRLSVTTGYYSLQQADEQVRIYRSAVRNSEASLRDAQALERAGVGTRFSVLQSQVNLASVQQQLTNAISQQRISRRQLAQVLNLKQSVDLSAADPVQEAGRWNQTLEESIVRAFQNRPDLQQYLAQRNQSEQLRRQALAQLGPQISLVASYGLGDTFSDSRSANDNYSVGVRGTLNLFDGGAARASANQQIANIRIAESKFADTRNQIRFQVEQYYSQLQANSENIQTANAALGQAREALRLARLRFQAGVGTQTDVIDAENSLTSAEGSRVTAILNYNNALASLQRAVTSRASR